MTLTIFFIIFFTGCFLREMYDTRSQIAKDDAVYYFVSLFGAAFYAFLTASQVSDLITKIHNL